MRAIDRHEEQKILCPRRASQRLARRPCPRSARRRHLAASKRCAGPVCASRPTARIAVADLVHDASIEIQKTKRLAGIVEIASPRPERARNLYPTRRADEVSAAGHD